MIPATRYTLRPINASIMSFLKLELLKLRMTEIVGCWSYSSENLRPNVCIVGNVVEQVIF